MNKNYILILKEKNSQIVWNHIQPEWLFEYWNVSINQIDILCNKKKYSHAIQMFNSLISILSKSNEYFNEFLFDATFFKTHSSIL